MVRHDWSGVRRKSLAPLVGVLAVGAATLGVLTPAGAQTAEPSGAYGYAVSDIILFNGNQQPFGPAPVVTLPEGGSATPITANAPSADARYGPGVLFTSGPLDVSTEGTTGPSGSVTSKAKVTQVPTSTSGEILYAGNIESTCTASGTGTTGSTAIAGPGDAGHSSATLRTSEGNPDDENDDTYADIPANPPANLEIAGKLESVNDTFRVVFNEQVNNGDGSITVNAVHEYLEGPTLKGNVIVGHVSCNIGASTSPTTAPETTDTTAPPASGGTGGTGTTGTGAGTSGMPSTGTNVTPLVFIGMELVAAGALAVFWAKRRRVWPLR